MENHVAVSASSTRKKMRKKKVSCYHDCVCGLQVSWTRCATQRKEGIIKNDNNNSGDFYSRDLCLSGLTLLALHYCYLGHVTEQGCTQTAYFTSSSLLQTCTDMTQVNRKQRKSAALFCLCVHEWQMQATKDLHIKLRSML